MVTTPLPPRRVTLVLCTAQDGVLGALPPFEVPTPYWQEAGDVVEAVRGLHGVDVTVLRLLSATQETPPDGGEVTYLAQVSRADAVRPGLSGALTRWSGPDPLADHVLRAPYAAPDGPTADLTWAAEALGAAGHVLTGSPAQVRTWNLSSLWRLPVTNAEGRPSTAWLKVVPVFFGHEGTVLAALAPTGVVPEVIAHARGPKDCGRTLLREVLGEDQYGAEPDRVAAFAGLLAGLHADWAGRRTDLARLDLPDRSDPDDVRHDAERLLDLVRTGAEDAGVLDPALHDDARRLVDQLPARLAVAEAAGSRVSLVHGDFHPGNVRGTPGDWRILDWGDSHVGQPAVDLALATAGMSLADTARVVAAAERVLRRRPADGPADGPAGGPAAGPVDLAAAVAAVRPLGPLLSALAWQRFLDAIEPDEHPYHAGDPAAGVRDAVLALRSS